ncbi:hypothetical protein D6774_02800 [Candidatus Woesearchaeota archaeon]|nr:MAG: hypothetical protein D6774_02800 [Candidatus Woesearchaeota archaeon]
MKQFEKNIRRSFHMVKKDIMRTHQEILALSQTQEKLLEIIDELRKNQEQLNAKINALEKKSKSAKAVTKIVEKKVKTPSKSSKKTYWASKTGKKFHDKHCPFAKNIKPKSRIVFKTKNTALNKGFKPCSCV